MPKWEFISTPRNSKPFALLHRCDKKGKVERLMWYAFECNTCKQPIPEELLTQRTLLNTGDRDGRQV